MQALIIVAIVFGCITLWLALIPGTIIFLKRSNKGGLSGKSKGLADEETRMIQEIYQSLSRMEKRVEALETLLRDKERKDKKE